MDSNSQNTNSKEMQFFAQYLENDPSEINFDKNANAANFSFSNFVSDYAAEGMANLTRQLVTSEAIALIDDLEAKDKNVINFNFKEKGNLACLVPSQPSNVEQFEKYTVSLSKSDVAEFWQREAHAKNANFREFYFHDITKGIIPYCYSTSTGRILSEGLQYIEDYPSSRPTRFDSYIAQVIDLVLEMSQDHAGAIAVPDLFVNGSTFFQSPEQVFAKKYYIANVFQSMIFTFHRKVRPSGQAPFVNVTIADEPTLKEVFQLMPEQISIVKALQEVFLDEFIKGVKGKPFRFPVTTANIALDSNKEIIDTDWLNRIARFLKTGRLNIYISKDPRKFASCCRMTNDLDLLMNMVGVDSFGNGGVRIGSHRVITLNLPKIIQNCNGVLKGKDVPKDRTLVQKTVLASVMLKAHRELLRNLINHKSGKFLKFFKHKWEDLDSNFFSTVGVIGIWEAAKASLEQNGVLNPTTRQVVDEQKRLLSYIKGTVERMSRELNMPMNIEQIPGESAAVDLAEGTGYQILSNQYIPLWEPVNLIERIKYAGELDEYYSGGAITHLNIEKALTEDAIIKIVEMAAKAGMTHFAPTHIYSQCVNDHNTIGKYTSCPICGEEIKDYVTRIIGYFVPVSTWNVGRKKEFHTRHYEQSLAN